VYRGFDIGTDKMPMEDRREIPHYLIDVVAPTEQYTAARYACDAAAAIQQIAEAGKIPILVGGTGLYYRALTRGLFPGPGRDDILRARLSRGARRHGVAWLHRMVTRVDPESGRRIKPADERRLIRALEVFFLTKRPLTDHFAETQSPLRDYRVISFALRLPAAEIARRVSRRVDEQFDRGLLDEIRRLREEGVPLDAPPFSGLVYRQAVEHLHGIRDAISTRELIVRENQRYARRQLIWFRKEPNLHWIDLPGEHPDALTVVMRTLGH
jgi:tRNA dimethylallyltransferase